MATAVWEVNPKKPDTKRWAELIDFLNSRGLVNYPVEILVLGMAIRVTKLSVNAEPQAAAVAAEDEA